MHAHWAAHSTRERDPPQAASLDLATMHTRGSSMRYGSVESHAFTPPSRSATTTERSPPKPGSEGAKVCHVTYICRCPTACGFSP